MFYIKVSRRLFINKNDKTKVIFEKTRGRNFKCKQNYARVEMASFRSCRGLTSPGVLVFKGILITRHDEICLYKRILILKFSLGTSTTNLITQKF